MTNFPVIIVKKPSIPILFLDTCFFIELVHDNHGISKNPREEYKKELIEIINKLTREKKLLAPVGDQDEEYEQGNKFEEEIRNLQSSISLGIRVNYHYGVLKWQTQIAVKAFLEESDKVVYDYRCLFDKDPTKQLDEQLSRKFIVNVTIPTPLESLLQRRNTKRNLAEKFEIMRKEKSKLKISYQDWVNAEKLGTHNLMISVIKSVTKKFINGEKIDENEKSILDELGEVIFYLSHFGEKEATLKEALAFLKSKYFFSIPYIETQSMLYASFWNQSGKIRPTDNFDFQQASQMLPFSHYYLTDNPFKHRLVTSPVKLNEKYNVKIFSMKEMPELIHELRTLH